MDVSQIVALTKARLGISTTVRDTYLTAIADGVVQELSTQQGLTLDPDNAAHLMFCVDLVTWRYHSVSNSQTNSIGSPLSMPRHLQFRLHNLIMSARGDQS